MRARDLIDETRLSITANKARSTLTILGIVVGIASVIVMVAIGQGAKTSIQSSIQQAGSNLVMVMPGFGRDRGAGVRQARGSFSSLTKEDAAAIGQLSGVAEVSQEVSTRQQVVAAGTNTNTSISGVTPVYTTVHNSVVAEGQFVTQQDVDGTGRVAVLGSQTRDDLFGEGGSALGAKIRIGSLQFRVVGVMQSKGGSGFGNADDVIYIPLTTAQRLLLGDTHLNQINLTVASADQMSAVQQSVTDLLLQRHKIADSTQADFNVMSQNDILQTMSTVTNTFTIVLASIAAISLLVGGIGIMNMMLTAVTERTREIGLRKAIGARRGDITAQFLTESAALTLLGGIVGVLLGYGFSAALTAFFQISTTVSVASVLLATGVSIAIGLVFGYYPARRAAAMNPVEALRYQ